MRAGARQQPERRAPARATSSQRRDGPRRGRAGLRTELHGTPNDRRAVRALEADAAAHPCDGVDDQADEAIVITAARRHPAPGPGRAAAHVPALPCIASNACHVIAGLKPSRTGAPAVLLWGAAPKIPGFSCGLLDHAPEDLGELVEVLLRGALGGLQRERLGDQPRVVAGEVALRRRSRSCGRGRWSCGCPSRRTSAPSCSGPAPAAAWCWSRRTRGSTPGSRAPSRIR